MAVNDKRDLVRMKKRLTVRFGIDETNRVAFSEDVSRSGMFIKTLNICPPNTTIKIQFMISDTPVELIARVMWAKKVPHNLFHIVKKSGMGVSFLQVITGEEYLYKYLEDTA